MTDAKDMFHEMEILRVLPKEDVTEFRLVSRQPSRRTVEVTLNSSCFRVMTDSQEGLKDQTFESFEPQLQSTAYFRRTSTGDSEKHLRTILKTAFYFQFVPWCRFVVNVILI